MVRLGEQGEAGEAEGDGEAGEPGEAEGAEGAEGAGGEDDAMFYAHQLTHYPLPIQLSTGFVLKKTP